MFIYIIICLFFLILFGQSSFDKIINKNENISWLKQHFNNSIIKNHVSLAFFTLTFLEFVTTILFLINILIVLPLETLSFSLKNALGIFCLNDPLLAFYMSLVTFICLFFGQRVAKDYDGAKTITIYFTLNLLAVIYVIEYL